MSGEATAACLALAEALASRIAHDASGSLQALVAAVELLSAEDEAVRAEAGSLAAEAVQRLRARIGLLRAAWGRPSAPLSLEAIAQLVSEGVGPPAVTIDFGRLEPGPWAVEGYDRVFLNALLVAAESLPRGGSVLCAGTSQGEIALAILGEGAAWLPGLAAVAAGDDPLGLVEPRRLAVCMLALVARRHHVALSLMLGGSLPLLLLRPAAPG